MGIDTRYSVVDCCRISSSRQLDSVLDLGKQPLANSLKNDAVNRESLFPLTLSYCSHSSLLQLNETVDKGILFDNYVWVTGTSEVARTYANQFANRVLDISGLDPDDLVVELSSRYIYLYETITGSIFPFPDKDIAVQERIKENLKEYIK